MTMLGSNSFLYGHRNRMLCLLCLPKIKIIRTWEWADKLFLYFPSRKKKRFIQTW